MRTQLHLTNTVSYFVLSVFIFCLSSSVAFGQGPEQKYRLYLPMVEAQLNRSDLNIIPDKQDAIDTFAGADPHLYGQWSDPIPWPLTSVHASLLPNGHILTFDAAPDDYENDNDPHTIPDSTTRADIYLSLIHI